MIVIWALSEVVLRAHSCSSHRRTSTGTRKGKVETSDRFIPHLIQYLVDIEMMTLRNHGDLRAN
jgi:hypothetical protein